MKRRQARTKAFLDQLREAIGALQKMKPGETHVLSINANYGHYQLVIGPGPEGEKMGKGEGQAIEINGEIHHLFVSPDAVRAQPSREQVVENLRDTVILRGCTIHLKDPMGDGRHLDGGSSKTNGMHAREYINLAGSQGENLIKEIEHSEKMTLEAYKIVQQDILKALKEHKKESLESVD
ncbi:MAG: hypothetical protein WC956_02100 [bacterium]